MLPEGKMPEKLKRAMKVEVDPASANFFSYQLTNLINENGMTLDGAAEKLARDYISTQKGNRSTERKMLSDAVEAMKLRLDRN